MAVLGGTDLTVLARQTQPTLSVTTGVVRAHVPAGHELRAAAVAGAA